MLAKHILKDVRYKLSDSKMSRWSDDRLLTLLNEGLIDVAKNTTLFVETLIYPIPTETYDIDLTSRALKIVGARYLDEPLPFLSYEEADKKFGSKWEHEEGTEVKAIIYDKQKNMVLRQYPILSTSHNPHIIYSSPYGVVTYISYSDIQPVLANSYGDISSIPDEALIKFFYVRKHPEIKDINDTLYIDDLIKAPLVHYIAGHAFRDNQDVQNRTLGNEEIDQYFAKINDYDIQKSQLYVRADHETRYNPHD